MILGRTYKIVKEYLKSACRFSGIPPHVTVFGSARIQEGHEYYTLAQKVGKTLSDMGISVMTGGGPGLMEAANKGAQEGQGSSLGCQIQLPEEQGLNNYCDDFVLFKYFFLRKFSMGKNASVFVALPGGFGTLDEAFEMLTLMQTGKMSKKPIFFMGKAFWEPILKPMIGMMLKAGTISPEDKYFIHITDNPEVIVNYIKAMEWAKAATK